MPISSQKKKSDLNRKQSHTCQSNYIWNIPIDYSTSTMFCVSDSSPDLEFKENMIYIRFKKDTKKV